MTEWNAIFNSKWLPLVFSSGVLGALLIIGGDIYLEGKRIDAASLERIIEIRTNYIVEIEALHEAFRGQVATLNLDNAPPLDQALIGSMLENLRAQDLRLSALTSSEDVSEISSIEAYRLNLLDIRDVLINSNDPGDLVDLAPLIVTMVRDFNELSSTLLMPS